MKKIFLIAIMSLLSSALFSSQLRVEQLGSGWLVPDEYVDTNCNPARINNITKNSISLNLSNDLTIQKRTDPDGYTERIDLNDDVEFGLINRFSLLNTGLIFKEDYSYLYRGGASEREHNYNLEFHGIFGFEINELLSTGVDILLSQYSLYNNFGWVGAYQGLSVGVNFSNSGFDLGVVVAGYTRLMGLRDYSLKASLFSEWKQPDEIIYRALLSLGYVQDGIKEPDTSVFNDIFWGNRNIINLVGFSIIGKYNDLRYVVSIKNDLNFLNQNFWSLGAEYEKVEYNSSTEDFWSQLGIESPLFVKWFKIRLKQDVFHIVYRFDSNHRASNTYTYEESHNEFSITFFPIYETVIGVSIDIGENFVLDFSYKPAFVFSNTQSNYTNSYYYGDTKDQVQNYDIQGNITFIY